MAEDMSEEYRHMKEIRPIGGASPEASEAEIARILGLGERREYFLSETIGRPETGAGEAEVLVLTEFLWPNEFRGETISSWEASPILDVMFKRGRRPEQVEMLKEKRKRRLEELNKATGADVSGLSKDERKNFKAGFSDKPELILFDRFEQTEALIEARRKETEADEWLKLYDHVKASISFNNVYAIRVLTQVNTENYAKLYERPETVTSTELADLFDPEYGYGRAAEWALEDYLDVHLEGGLRDPKDPKNIIRVVKELKVSEVTKDEDEVKGILGAAQQIGIEVDEKARILRNIDIRDLQVLQKKANINATETVLATVIKDHLRQKDKTLDDFTIKRGILLAEHAIEAFLLGPWLAVPRENKAKKGELDRWETVYGEDNLKRILGGEDRFKQLGYKDGDQLPRIGWARPEEGGAQNVVWLVLFRLKALSEARQGFRGGAPVLQKDLPEYLIPPFFLDKGMAGVKLGKGRKVYKEKDSRGEKEVSVLEAWYYANKQRAEQGQARVSLSEVFRNVPEGAFGRWLADRVNRANQVRNFLLANIRGGKDDVIEQLFLPDNLRELNKAFARTFPDRDQRQLVKANSVVAHIQPWKNELDNLSEITTTHPKIGQKIQELAETKETIKKACLKSKFFNQREWDLVNGAIDNNGLVTVTEISGVKGTSDLGED